MELNEKNFRNFLMECAKYYEKSRQKIGMPLDVEKLKRKIEEYDIKIVDNGNTNGTFQVKQKSNMMRVVRNTFESNGNERNIFLLLHEFSHLDSEFNKNLPSDMSQIECYDEFESIKNNDDLSKIDIYYSFVAIDEVITQWCCEHCNAAIKNKTIENKHVDYYSILGTNVKAITDFSNHDCYAPLQQYVETIAKELGYNDFAEFAKNVMSGKEKIYDKINEKNVEEFGYLGILCEGIYQENKFNNCGLPPTDIPKAIAYLENRKMDFPSAPQNR